MQQINTAKEKITVFHCCFQPIFLSFKKQFKNVFNNFIYFIISYDFYVIIFSLDNTVFVIIFLKNKVNCYCQLNFLFIRCFEINYWCKFRFGLILLRFSSIENVLFLSPLLSYSNLCLTIKITFFLWFLIRFLIFLNILSLVASFSFFGLQSLTSYIVNCVVFRLFLRFYLAWFLSTTIHIFDMYWFTIILGCVCFKKSSFLTLNGYSLTLEFYFFLYCLSISSILSPYFGFYDVDVLSVPSLWISR